MRERSIVNYVDKLPNIPYLILHGTGDDKVSCTSTVKFVDHLLINKKNITFNMIANGTHGLSNYNWQKNIMEWLNS